MSGITLTKIAAASIPTPAANKVTIFDETTTGEPSYKDDTGTVTSLKGTNGSNGASGGSAQIASIAAASAAIANTETVVVSASLAANYMTAGMSFRIRAAGVGTTGLTPGVDTFRIRIGTTTLTGNIPTSVAPAANASVTAQPFSFEALVTVRTAGAGGTIIGECLAVGDDVATGLFTTLVDLSATVATVAVDTTATKLLELTFQSATAGSSCTFHVATIEVLNSGAAGGGATNLTSAKYKRTTGDYTTTSNSFVDVDATNLALTITTGARRVLVSLVASGYNTTAGEYIGLDVDLDGARMIGGSFGLFVNSPTNEPKNLSFTILSDVLTAASHTFKLQYRRLAAGTVTLYGTGNSQLVFSVVELYA